MSKRNHVPIRMCIGCRKRRKKEEMIRFIRETDGVILAKEQKNVEGRGFYLCPELFCFKKAEKKEKWMGPLGWVNSLKEGLS